MFDPIARKRALSPFLPFSPPLFSLHGELGCPDSSRFLVAVSPPPIAMSIIRFIINITVAVTATTLAGCLTPTQINESKGSIIKGLEIFSDSTTMNKFDDVERLLRPNRSQNIKKPNGFIDFLESTYEFYGPCEKKYRIVSMQISAVGHPSAVKTERSCKAGVLREEYRWIPQRNAPALLQEYFLVGLQRDLLKFIDKKKRKNP